MTMSLRMLEDQFIKMESDPVNEESKNKEKPTLEKISSIPNMLKCYICEGLIFSYTVLISLHLKKILKILKNKKSLQ